MTFPPVDFSSRTLGVVSPADLDELDAKLLAINTRNFKTE